MPKTKGKKLSFPPQIGIVKATISCPFQISLEQILTEGELECSHVSLQSTQEDPEKSLIRKGAMKRGKCYYMFSFINHEEPKLRI